jgi:hypothetical protein
MWRSRPSGWAFASSAIDVAIVSTLAWSGTLMAPLRWHLRLAVAAAGVGFAVLLDQVKRPIMAAFRVE